jgi:membrane fusion protein (multidrug efflux system)
MIGVPALIALAALAYFLMGGRYQSTDDAYVKLARAGISANVAGRVIAVPVRENQMVKAGDTLFQLDAEPFQIAVQRAEAAVGGAMTEARVLLATYRERLADQAAAEEAVEYTAREAKRQQGLSAAGVNTKGQADEAVHAAGQAAARLRLAQQEVASALAAIGGNPDQPPERFAGVRKAKADLDEARLNLGYATVVAPVDGMVTKVDQLQPGARIAASQTVFWLVSGKPWIEANFKEDQIAKMRVGQPVTITVDAYDHEIKGRVASFSPGTGSSFSLLPPENATGNWVKVVQRLPVQIEITSELPADSPLLSAGLSATVEVDTAPP